MPGMPFRQFLHSIIFRPININAVKDKLAGRFGCWALHGIVHSEYRLARRLIVEVLAWDLFRIPQRSLPRLLAHLQNPKI